MSASAGFRIDTPVPTCQPSGEETAPARRWSLPADLSELEDNQFLSTLINLFINDADKRVSALKEAQNSGDSSILRVQAHALKGSSLQMGATPLALDCAALELAARDQQSTCLLLVDAVVKDYQFVRQEMETFISRA